MDRSHAIPINFQMTFLQNLKTHPEIPMESKTSEITDTGEDVEK